MSNVDAEDLIAHLSGGLAPADREAFRRAAENALATSAQCWGPGLIHRTVVSIWRAYFHPPPEDRVSQPGTGRRRVSKLITEPPKDGHARRRSRRIQVVR